MRIVSFLLALLISSFSFADCDFSKIISNSDGSYQYSKELHICVGQLVKDSKTKDAQILDLYGAVDKYKQTIATDEIRIQNLMDSLGKISERIDKAQQYQNSNDTLKYVIGAAAAYLSVWGAGQLRN